MQDTPSFAELSRYGHDIAVKYDWERMSMGVLSGITVDGDSGV